uniref:Uncharacterized protein n=1 Tax=Hucho hucho TaxID=62062 RepID=A0A4W5PVN4_9TELE
SCILFYKTFLSSPSSALFPFTAPILEKIKFSFVPTAVTDFFYASLAKIKSGRDTGNSTSRVDFLQLMIDSQKGNDTKTGDEQTKGTCQTFIWKLFLQTHTCKLLLPTHTCKLLLPTHT